MRISLTIDVEAPEVAAMGLLPERTGSVTREELEKIGARFTPEDVFYARREETPDETAERRSDQYFDEEYS